MYGCKSFLMIGPEAPADILTLTQGGYEILDCNFSFQQAVDQFGKATTRVHSGTLHITLSQLPRKDLIDWALNSRKYSDGMIVLVNAENEPVEKIYFENATCISFEVDYTQRGESYTFTKMIVQAEKMTVGSGIDFKNHWIYDY